MARRPLSLGLFAIFLAVLCGNATVATATAPVLKAAVSRQVHGAAGTFDVQLPLTGGTGIESRSASTGLNIVLIFDQTVTGGTAAMTTGTAAFNGAPVFSGNTMTVKLKATPLNAAPYTITVSNITNAANEKLASAAVSFRRLKGDINASGTVTASDINTISAAISAGGKVNGSNFRCDIDLSGVITSADTNLVSGLVNTTVAGGATANTAPTIAAIPDQTAYSGQSNPPISVTVGDSLSDPNTLYVSATSSNQTILPNSAIVVGGTGTARTLVLSPPLSQKGDVVVTVNVSDGLLITTIKFNLSVAPPPSLYLATMIPQPGIVSQGYGSATLKLSDDRTYATLRFKYSNLSSPKVAEHIHGPSNGVPTAILFDIDTPAPPSPTTQPLADGSYKWVFPTSGSPSASDILTSIQQGVTYINIHTSNYPNGEIKGYFTVATGSQTFVPPNPPPAITINPPTNYDAARLLQQAAFGGNLTEVNALSNTAAPNASTAIQDWLTAQFNSKPPIAFKQPSTTQPSYLAAATPSVADFSSSSMFKTVYDRVTTPQAPNAYGDLLNTDRVTEVWWGNAVAGPDQLRQRVATALSELFVVSEDDGTIAGSVPALTTYYDMLADNTFTNFRQLLGEVTLHPVMGKYLNMLGNAYKNTTPPTSPNENYAREIMQLFSVGLYMLQPDGTLMLDANGEPIPTYDQSTITGFAHVFTGWNTNPATVTIPTLIAPVAPATQPTVSNFVTSYMKPMVVTAANHSPKSKQLLIYPGATTYPAATQPALIPAASQTTTTAAQELTFALDNIFNHPNVGPFISRQLIQRLVNSNPSPGYVYRVAQKFNNNGSGVRGDMKAVLTAIFTDYEARSPSVVGAPWYGHQREPLIRVVNILRPLHALSKTGKWKVGRTDTKLNQTILRSPTVFNFFEPGFAQPGGIQNAGLVSPEFEIIYETTVTNSQNMIYTGIYSNNYATPPVGTGFMGDNYGSDVYLDFSATGSGLTALAQTSGVSAMIDQVALLLNAGPLDPTMKSTIQNFISSSLNATDYLGQVKAAVHLIATSSQVAAEK